MSYSSIESLIEKIQMEHQQRLDTPNKNPLKAKPFRPRPRPKTVIISRAAISKLQKD